MSNKNEVSKMQKNVFSLFKKNNWSYAPYMISMNFVTKKYISQLVF